MADGARAFAIPPVGRFFAGINVRRWVPVWSTTAAFRALRSVIVIPPLFAFTDQVIGNVQIATFTAFGGFATLVLASFGGNRRDKLVAHLALALVGSVLLTIGTAVNSMAAVAGIVTVPVAFAVFFAGVTGPNAASAVFAALLLYVLPAASPGDMGMVPDRLAGWWLASVVGTIAVLVLSPRPDSDRLRSAANRIAVALADTLDDALAGTSTATDIDYCVECKNQLLTVFTATPYRPIGLATADQAFANAIELLEWCTALLIDVLHEFDSLADARSTEYDLLRQVSFTLREVATLLSDGKGDPDLDELERVRAVSSDALGDLSRDGENFRRSVQLSFHAQTIAVAVAALAADALVAARVADLETILARRALWTSDPAWNGPAARRLPAVASAAHVAMRNASLRSVWFVNSLRGSVAIAAAVAIAIAADVQHGFWVVLGTLSVLRTSASATGSTAFNALLGTVAGFIVGGALLVLIGSTTAALWAALPIAVLVASYAPGTAPFAVGQAAFTVLVAVLFNLLVPVGWRVGVVRVQDVAIGCAVSVVVGILFWPRGVSGVVGDDLADAFRLGAAYLIEAVEWTTGLRQAVPDLAADVATATLRLDDALRGFLAEQGSKRMRKEELWRLIGGSMRLRLSAHALARLPHGVADAGRTGPTLVDRARLLGVWYERLAARVDRPSRNTLTTLEPPSLDSVAQIAPPATGPAACYTIWVEENLNHLAEHIGALVGPAAHIAEVRGRPWWR